MSVSRAACAPACAHTPHAARLTPHAAPRGRAAAGPLLRSSPSLRRWGRGGACARGRHLPPLNILFQQVPELDAPGGPSGPQCASRENILALGGTKIETLNVETHVPTWT